MDWLSALQQLRAEGGSGVLVTVIEVRGHAPRDPGAKMLVGTDRLWGSVGGGNLEEMAVVRARQLIEARVARTEVLEARLNDHGHNEFGRQCCGGEVRLLLEPFLARPVVAIFGMGHVGFELARILSRLELQLHLVDSRADQLDELRLADITAGAADVHIHRAVLGELVLERLPAGAHVVLMSHDHAEDYALCDAAIRLPGLAGIGLIGSSAKWARFRRNLAAAGHSEQQIARVRCHIGLSGPTGSPRRDPVPRVGAGHPGGPFRRRSRRPRVRGRCWAGRPRRGDPRARQLLRNLGRLPG
jgi:xanthine dehydrogenase accessory factor